MGHEPSWRIDHYLVSCADAILLAELIWWLGEEIKDSKLLLGHFLLNVTLYFLIKFLCKLDKFIEELINIHPSLVIIINQLLQTLPVADH